MKRKKGGNLLVAELNDVLTEEVMNAVQVYDTEYLKTLFIAIPKSAKENFEGSIYELGNDLVGFGGERCHFASKCCDSLALYTNKIS
jgi:V-type H+-transporting ATPase subunit C